jgi:1-acyl-sn-glycerol-3-phosphate acyltransferase
MRRLIDLPYALIATPVFCVLMFGLFCPLILLLPTLAARRALGRASVRICLAAIGVPLRVHGLERLPAGAAIAVANHASYMDGLVLTAALPARYTFVVQDGAAAWPLVGAVLRRMGVAFINRDTVREGARQTRALLKGLHSGTSLAIFAEGTFPDRPGLLAFKTGAFLLAARAQVPVAPVVIHGSRRLLGGGWWGFRWSPVRIVVLAEQRPEGSDRAAATALRDRVRQAILQRCGDPDAAAATTPEAA